MGPEWSKTDEYLAKQITEIHQTVNEINKKLARLETRNKTHTIIVAAAVSSFFGNLKSITKWLNF